jgi:hypothetical protein
MPLMINTVGPYNAQNSHIFCLFQFCFFSERQYLWPYSHFLADYVPYSITVDAIRTIPGVHLAFMASAVKLQ